MPDLFVAGNPAKLAKKKPPMTVIPSGGSLAAFIACPRNIRFDIQEKEEKIILLLRRHPITNLPWLLLALLVVIAPFFLVNLVSLDFIPLRFQFILTIIWYLLTFAFVFEKFLTWFFNVDIITDERIVDIDFPNILYKDISETKIDQVQDVSVKVGGFIRSLFDFGDVLIQTAGTVPEISFNDVPHPSQVSQVLGVLRLEEEQEKIEGRAR